MGNKLDSFLKEADYVLVVNKDFEIIYHSRFDPRMGSNANSRPYRTLFEAYPSIARNESSIVRTMSTGVGVFKDAQQFADLNGKVYVTRNLTIPLFHEGQVVGVVELTKDLTTIGDVEGKDVTLSGLQENDGVLRERKREGKISFDDILTISDSLISAKEQARIFAGNSNPVLICGETGTGKEMFAQAMIDYISESRDKVVIQNCAAVPENLIESILFGTVKGAYTGAENRKGMFEEAEGGVFFLDELHALPYHVQGKLLRVLQEGTFRPVGSNREKKVRVKIIAAINMDPVTAMERKILRKDLFYRLSSSVLYLPPLRERPDDIEYLTDHYINEFNSSYGNHIKGISEQLRRFFLNYEWEGNVRELRHVLESMVSTSRNEVLDVRDLPIYLSDKRNRSMGKNNGSTREKTSARITVDLPSGDHDLNQIMEEVERQLITRALEATGGNKTKAGAILGIPRQTLRYKMSRLDLMDEEE